MIYIRDVKGEEVRRAGEEEERKYGDTVVLGHEFDDLLGERLRSSRDTNDRGRLKLLEEEKVRNGTFG